MMKERKVTKRHPTKNKPVRYRVYELYRMLPLQNPNLHKIDLRRDSQGANDSLASIESDRQEKAE
jgi:hypothetical protein